MTILNKQQFTEVHHKYSDPMYVYLRSRPNYGLLDIDICRNQKDEGIGGYWDTMHFPANGEDYKTYAVFHQKKIGFYRKYLQWIFGSMR